MTQHRQAVAVGDPAHLAGYVEMLVGTAGERGGDLQACCVWCEAGDDVCGLSSAQCAAAAALPRPPCPAPAGLEKQLEEVGREAAAQAAAYDEAEEGMAE